MVEEQEMRDMRDGQAADGSDDDSDKLTTTTERNKRDFKLTSESERIQNELCVSSLTRLFGAPR